LTSPSKITLKPVRKRLPSANKNTGFAKRWYRIPFANQRFDQVLYFLLFDFSRIEQIPQLNYTFTPSFAQSQGATIRQNERKNRQIFVSVNVLSKS
jgi:hypothetical protein